MTMVDATTNPEQANAMLAGVLAEVNSPSAPAAPVQMPTVVPPPDREVQLVGGIPNQLDGTRVTNAVVRELNGADEEALTSPQLARSVSKYLAAVVQRGTETIGGEKPSKEALDGLLIGDRELLLLGIRKATYGHAVELVTTCPHCQDRDEDYVFDLNTVEVKELENPLEAVYGFDFECPSGITVHVHLPTAADQDHVLSVEGKSEGEYNTIMLSRIVEKIDGSMVLSDNQLRAMSIRDRKAILKAVTDRTPGPKLGEAKSTCRACEKEFDLGLGLLDIFRA